MPAKALDLFQAYAQNKLPQDGGYVVSSFLDETSAYSIYEVVAYGGVKNILLSSDALTFQTDGNKLYVLVEPATYHKKHVEPYLRDNKEQVPHRFSELEILTCKNQSKLMVSRQPIVTYSAFTILKPVGINFAFIFYNLAQVVATLRVFFARSLAEESGVPKADAQKGARLAVSGIRRFTIWG